MFLPFDPLVGHLVGDYILQNDFLAQGKKRSHAICAMHCVIWTCCVLCFGKWPWLLPLSSTLVAAGVLFVTHFLQDRWGLVQAWMRFAGQSQFMAMPRLEDGRLVPGLGPWSIIVVDNVLHIVTIWLVWQGLLLFNG